MTDSEKKLHEAEEAYKEALRQAREAKKGSSAQKKAVARLVPLWERYTELLYKEVMTTIRRHPPPSEAPPSSEEPPSE